VSTEQENLIKEAAMKALGGMSELAAAVTRLATAAEQANTLRERSAAALEKQAEAMDALAMRAMDYIEREFHAVK